MFGVRMSLPRYQTALRSRRQDDDDVWPSLLGYGRAKWQQKDGYRNEDAQQHEL
jgi:hypothetical protein